MSVELFAIDELARRLITPSPLDRSFCSGVFVQVTNAHEGTLFLRDLGMLLESAGVQVFKLHGQDLILPFALASLVSLIEVVRSRPGARSNFPSSQTLAEAVTTAVGTRGNTLAFLIDSAQALLDESGTHVLKALKAARDAANLNPSQHARLLVVATCVQPERVERFVLDREGAFYGAAAVAISKLPN